jgi:putative restriction endonuclease
MRFYVGLTDESWFRFLSENRTNEVNFWRPRSQFQFRAINQYEPFLFKLKKPIDAIVGVGFLADFRMLPVQMAWDAFGKENGCPDFASFLQSLGRLAQENPAEVMERQIGCIILSDTLFFSEKDWIAAPPDWPASTMQGKTYSTEDAAGAQLWSEVLVRCGYNKQAKFVRDGHVDLGETYGGLGLVKKRMGQGLFQLLTLDNYRSTCCITGEMTKPVIEAAHILPVGAGGEHRLDNGLALGADMHKLFDRGLLAIDPDYRIHVSSKIRELYHNGVVYYAHQGQALRSLPDSLSARPNPEFLEQHFKERFIA